MKIGSAQSEYDDALTEVIQALAQIDRAASMVTKPFSEDNSQRLKAVVDVLRAMEDTFGKGLVRKGLEAQEQESQSPPPIRRAA